MPAIPASQIVSVVPSVIGAGGSALDLSGLALTNSLRIPIGTVPSFPDQASVAKYFGSTSAEAAFASIYFLGFDGSTVKPGALLMAQYPWLAPVGAWLRGGNVSGLTLAQLQALSGSLSVTVDGVVKTAASIVLSGASSFSAAAALIETGLGLTEPAGAALTGSIATTVLTATAVASGTIAVSQTLVGVGVTAGTKIVAQLTSTETDGHLGGKGTYTVSASQTVASESMTTTNPAVVYDSQSGGFQILSATTGATSTIGFASGTLAAPLLLTQATGAVTSQGAAIAVPATFMNGIVAVTQDWATFSTLFEPVTADKIALSAWNNGQANSYEYELWTNNAAATIVPDTTTAGANIIAAGYSGTKLIYTTGATAAIAAFEMGAIASLDTAATNGRATMMFRQQTGLAAEITDGTIAKNLQANGYNFYGDYSTRNDDFIFFVPGSVTGPFTWSDSYINQIWMSNSFQLALMSLLTTVKSIPYNTAGYALIRAACLDPIQSFVNFGAIRAGVSLSNAQAAEVNTAAGVKIDDVLSTRGWYLQILDPTAQVRAARGTPVCNFWYTDGQSVQRINLASVAIQ